METVLARFQKEPGQSGESRDVARILNRSFGGSRSRVASKFDVSILPLNNRGSRTWKRGRERRGGGTGLFQRRKGKACVVVHIRCLCIHINWISRAKAERAASFSVNLNFISVRRLRTTVIRSKRDCRLAPVLLELRSRPISLPSIHRIFLRSFQIRLCMNVYILNVSLFLERLFEARMNIVESSERRSFSLGKTTRGEQYIA